MADSILEKVLSSKHAEEVAHFAPQEILVRILQPLPSRDRGILTRRFGLQGGAKETLEEIGKTLEITRERVRQIERGAIKKIREHANFLSSITVVEHIVRQCLEEVGGVLPVNELYERCIAGRDHPVEARAILSFLLEELLRDRFQCIALDEQCSEGWALRTVSLETLHNTCTGLERILEEQKTPVDFSTIARLYRNRNTNEEISDERLEALLSLAKNIQKNIFGEWGMSSWQTIHPKRMKDKIYLILKRHGKPLHFNDITERINTAQFDQKIAHPPTVHNELIMDERFVLVGRGMYALGEWGYKPGTVSDVVLDILKNEKDALSREEIVRRVLTQRFVGKATVHLALMDRERFTKLPDERYILTQPTS
ncbi:MAG: sigma factor-like helix-turn-helix DNA-binding protein [bacterium]|nr:sigma factor-like helix-turn-helix DNA-binding protein [bacterium]